MNDNPFSGCNTVNRDCKIERNHYRKFEVRCLSFRQSGLVARVFLTMIRYICFTGGWLRNQSMQLARMERQVHKGLSVRKKFCNSRKKRCKIGSYDHNFSWIFSHFTRCNI